MRFKKTAAAAALAVSALVLSACAPGGTTASGEQSLGPVSKDFGTEDITLTVWDQNTDDTFDSVQKQLNAAFEEAHPNVTIARVTRSFGDLKTTLKLALSGPDAPDVVQANQGYPDMGAFVKAGLLRPLDDYSDLYSWDEGYPADLLALNSFSDDGKTWQGDNLYGLSQTATMVGLYYNKSVLAAAGVTAPPTTIAELTDAMAKVKQNGTLPLSVGNRAKSAGIHLYGFAMAATAGAAAGDLVTSAGGEWTSPEAVEAAGILSGWQSDGYITPGANGLSSDEAVAAFGTGQSAFFISGSWWGPAMQATPSGSDIGFAVLSPENSDTPVAMGGEGPAWAMTSGTDHADAAAAYIDFVTNSASDEFAEAGNLPVLTPEAYAPASGSIAENIATSYAAVSGSDGLVPFLDYATPTFFDTLTTSAQDLIAGQATPEEFTGKLQDDYAAFAASRG
jgi:raffinose/stachyose/melibiose transport system substrate-binding protein